MVPFAQQTGCGVRIAVIDSGVNPDHPHIDGVAGGVRIGVDAEDHNYLDFLGHGTAVMAAIREKAPAAHLYAVKVFERSLTTNIDVTIRAIEWAIDHQMHVINLSLGTLNPAHRERFERALDLVTASGAILLSALEIGGKAALPGCLPSVIGVGADYDCPRESYYSRSTDSGPAFFASGYPRSLPNVPPESNLRGVSFAVANMTGIAARACEAHAGCSPADIRQVLFDTRLDAALYR
jgi:subtilisin family serine protease